MWRSIDWLMFGARTLMYASIVAYHFIEDPVDSAVWLTAIWFAVSFAAPLLFWRPGYKSIPLYAVTDLIVSGSLSVYLNLNSPVSVSIFMVTCVMIGYLGGLKSLRWTAPVMLVAFPFLEWLFILQNLEHTLIHVGTYTGALCFGLCLHIIRSQNNMLLQYAEQIEELTVAEERSRIARELHDTIGHTLTSSIVGIEASIVLIDRDAQQAKHKLEKLQALLTKELESVRARVHAMATHEEDIPLMVRMQDMVAHFEETASCRVSLEAVGTEPSLNNTEKMTLLRFLQEALTNAKRHGDASLCRVTLTFEPHRTTLRVTDNGFGAEKLMFGFGLRTMHERLLACQGELHIQSTPGEGTVLTCILATEGGAT